MALSLQKCDVGGVERGESVGRENLSYFIEWVLVKNKSGLYYSCKGRKWSFVDLFVYT